MGPELRASAKTLPQSHRTGEILSALISSAASNLHAMPRPPRFVFANECYHVLNRANRKAEVFHEPADYFAFLALMTKAQERLELPLIAACLMPNHVHLVVRPVHGGDLARWMQWLFATHALHYHKKYVATGHVWQGRYKHVPIQGDHHLLTVMRYVERNALRSKLVARAESWRWGSLNWRSRDNPLLTLAASPIALPAWWADYVNEPQTAAELDAIRTSVNRQRPFGESSWVEEKARACKLGQSLGTVGRPGRNSSGPIC
jgi:putative transposase